MESLTKLVETREAGPSSFVRLGCMVYFLLNLRLGFGAIGGKRLENLVPTALNSSVFCSSTGGSMAGSIIVF